jgi:hypothetical protein
VVTHEVELPAGVHQVRFVARDTGSGRVGSVSHRIDVPGRFDFRITTPLVSDTLEPVPTGTPPRLAPIARREFTPGRVNHQSLDIFGAEKGGVTGRPRGRWATRRPRTAGPTRWSQPIEPAPTGHVASLLHGRTRQSGEYRIEGEVVDGTGRCCSSTSLHAGRELVFGEVTKEGTAFSRAFGPSTRLWDPTVRLPDGRAELLERFGAARDAVFRLPRHGEGGAAGSRPGGRARRDPAAAPARSAAEKGVRGHSAAPAIIRRAFVLRTPQPV